jgi:predicted nucleic-acid-binding Zn-ribbon protein
MPTKITTEEFVNRAKAIHGDTYGYEFVNYVGNNTPVSIVCKIHGVFSQRPSVHWLGGGCIKCGYVNTGKGLTSNTDEFIKKAVAIHGERYDYSLVDYKLATKKISIICKIHGVFEQVPNSHLRGVNCPKCGAISIGRKLSSNKEKFVSRANAVHGNKYDYSLVRYNGKDNKVMIICTKHGEFEQSPHNHMAGDGCPKCGREALSNLKKMTTQDFIERSKIVHNNLYDYSRSIYSGWDSQVEIICKSHGVFKQHAGTHLKGSGCSKCKFERSAFFANGWSLTRWVNASKKSKTFSGFKCYLALLGNNESGEYFIKVGRTYTDVERRFNGIPYKYKTIATINGDAEYIFNKELEIKRLLKPYKMIPSVLFGGRQECYTISALDLAMTAFEESHNKMQSR